MGRFEDSDDQIGGKQLKLLNEALSVAAAEIEVLVIMRLF
jgi:hypothetical protein